jgi:hypothetical protein
VDVEVAQSCGMVSQSGEGAAPSSMVGWQSLFNTTSQLGQMKQRAERLATSGSQLLMASVL